MLIAEDDENSRVLLENMLASNGYDVLCAANGQEALALAKANPPAMIISDILMPVMDGYAFCRALKKDGKLKHIPFIFYTATYTDKTDQIFAFSLGADRFVLKPTEMSELMAIMNEVFEIHKKCSIGSGVPIYSDSKLEFLHSERLQNKLSKKLAELEYQKKMLHDSEQRFLDFAEVSEDWFWETDKDLVITKITTGPTELLARKLTDLATKISNQSYPGETCSKYLKALERKHEFQDVVLSFTSTHQQSLSIRFSGKPIFNQSNQFEGYRCVGADVTEIIALIRKVEHLTTYDGLTGLPNRPCFWERLDLAINRAERYGYQLILFFIDVDQFKLINDTLGHDAGDQLLVEITHRIRQAISHPDTLARIGADEFVLIMEQASPSDANSIVLAILKEFERPFLVNQQRIFTSVSIGLSVYPDDSSQAQMLVSYADLAMYRAKSKGRNNFHYYTEELNHSACEWMSLENALRLAIERNELFLVYQPQINLQSGQLEGVEALLRWQHAGLGLVKPDKFIPIAEHSGFIIDLGVWCLKAVCRQIQKWDLLEIHIPRVSVNISAKHTRNRRILEDIKHVFSGSGVGLERLGIEITEHTLVEGVDTIRETLEEMHRCGIYLSLDDFGTGYSSLGYLKRIPVNELKIDRSFISGIAEQDYDTAIVKAIIALGQTLGMRVCAEGVETLEQSATLKALQCDFIQGFLIAEPFKPEEIENWLSNREITV